VLFVHSAVHVRCRTVCAWRMPTKRMKWARVMCL
jgi:hypothetical protein